MSGPLRWRSSGATAAPPAARPLGDVDGSDEAFDRFPDEVVPDAAPPPPPPTPRPPPANRSEAADARSAQLAGAARPPPHAPPIPAVALPRLLRTGVPAAEVGRECAVDVRPLARPETPPAAAAHAANCAARSSLIASAKGTCATTRCAPVAPAATAGAAGGSEASDGGVRRTLVPSSVSLRRPVDAASADAQPTQPPTPTGRYISGGVRAARNMHGC